MKSDYGKRPTITIKAEDWERIFGRGTNANKDEKGRCKGVVPETDPKVDIKSTGRKHQGTE